MSDFGIVLFSRGRKGEHFNRSCQFKHDIDSGITARQENVSLARTLLRNISELTPIEQILTQKK